MVEVGRNRWRHSSPVSLLRAGLAEGGCSGPCLIDFERMETPQPLWSTCSSTTLTIRTFLCLYRPSCMSCCAHCLSSWHCNAEEFALSSLLLPQVLIRINTYSPWTYYFLIVPYFLCSVLCFLLNSHPSVCWYEQQKHRSIVFLVFVKAVKCCLTC